MASKPIKTVLIGAGGYGNTYLELFLNGGISDIAYLAAAVEPNIGSINNYEQIKNTMPVYESIEEFYNHETADLAIISTPIHFHYDHCVTALKHGSHVLCEKPLVPTVKQLDSLEEEARRTSKTLSVGFQWCYSENILGIKKRIIAGEFGKPLQMKCMVSWPRDWRYYARSWAGKLKTAEGETVNDSVASNATAHYIQIMLFLLGKTIEESAAVEALNAECYRANKIESFDTILFKGKAAGADIFYCASHAVNYSIEPVMYYEFEKTSILINMFNQDFRCKLHHKNGLIEDLGDALGGGMANKAINAAKAAAGEEAFISNTRTVRPFTVFIDDLFKNVPIKNFPCEIVVNDEEAGRTYVRNLHMELAKRFETCELLNL